MNTAYLPVLGHTIATAVCGALLLLIYRDVRARSAPVAALLACGLLLRAAAGLVLFWISYLDAGWLSHLHLGDGFWLLAIDARGYYATAAEALETGISSISSTDASPAYTRVLALWMHVVGVSPASGFFLNLVLFASLGGLLARTFGVNGDWRNDLPCLLTLGAFTCSPVLIIHGTQPLKDDFFTFLIVGSILAAVAVAARLVPGTLPAHQIRVFVGSLLLLLLALYLMAGVRAYFAFLFCGSLSVALAVQAFRQRSDRLLPYLAASGATLLVVWTVSFAGAGPYGETVSGYIVRVLPAWIPIPAAGTAGALSEASGLVRTAREGFENTGGATNVTGWAMGPAGNQGTLSRVTLGAALLFVPVSLLRALSLVEFEGGRGLLILTDLDTLYLNFTIVIVSIFLFRERSRVRLNLPCVVLLVTLSLVTMLLMAYVVTNFGTLFRLRVMVMAPLWMLPLAVSRPLFLADDASVRGDARVPAHEPAPARFTEKGPDLGPAGARRTVVAMPGRGARARVRFRG